MSRNIQGENVKLKTINLHLENQITQLTNNWNKLKATLNCIKDSETILGGEYYVIHSDYIIALEEVLDKMKEIKEGK